MVMSRRRKNDFVATGLALVLSLILGSGTLACQDKGALEQAGEKTDEVIDDITHPGEGPVEEAGRKTGEKVEELTEDVDDQ